MVTVEQIKQNINEENLAEMKNYKMPYEWLEKECNEIIEDEKLETYEINALIKRIIYEYINEVLRRTNNKYELDWE